MRDPAAAERRLYRLARLAAHLPDALKVRLSGEPPVVVDGQTLDPQLQLLRSAAKQRRYGLIEPTIEAGRDRYHRQNQVFRGPVTKVGSVRDFEIPGAESSLRARHYAPAGPSEGQRPLTLYFHGGGFVIGDLDTHDEPCRILCREAAMHILSVAYRLAPEHPFPAAVDDAAAAWAWSRTHAASLGADPRRVAIGGDSAGANLAGVVAALAGQTGLPVAQLLIYPATDVRTDRPSQHLFAETFFLTLRDRDAFFRHYAGQIGADARDPRLSPLLLSDLSHVPPALVAIAGFDVLRDEGEAYAAALGAAGRSVRTLRFGSLGHGFIHMTGICPAARRAMVAIAREWKAMLEGGGT